MEEESCSQEHDSSPSSGTISSSPPTFSSSGSPPYFEILSQESLESLNSLSTSDSSSPEPVSSEGSASVQAHPLLHSLVLYNTFEYLPLKDQLNCRLVCSTWDTEVCRLLRKNLTLEFQDICHISSFKNLMDDNSVHKPYRDSPFARINLRSTFRLGHEIAQEFFKIYGGMIRHMKIAKVGCDCGANFLQKLLFYQAPNLSSLDLQIIASPIRLSPDSEYPDRYVRVKRAPVRMSSKWQLPNLKRLHLRHQLFYERPKFVEDLLQAAVNLEELTTDEANPLFCRNCFIPAILGNKFRWTKLKRIQVGDMLCFSNNQLVRFAMRKCPLEYLPLNFNILVPSFEVLNCDNLMELLKSLQNSLKRLELYNHRPDIASNFKSFPSLPRLEHLKVTNIYFPSYFLELLPNLKSFSVAHEDSTIYSSFFSLKIPPHPTLTTFALYYLSAMNLSNLRTWLAYWERNALSYCQQLSTAFPHLRILSLNGNDEVLKGIYETLPLLEELSIYGPVTDEGITGIPNYKCQQMNDENDFSLVDSEELDELKFIGDLKKLKRFTISSLGTTPMLTEVSVFLGFICCKDLVCLDIGDKRLTDMWQQEVKRVRGFTQPT